MIAIYVSRGTAVQSSEVTQFEINEIDKFGC